MINEVKHKEAELFKVFTEPSLLQTLNIIAKIKQNRFKAARQISM